LIISSSTKLLPFSLSSKGVLLVQQTPPVKRTSVADRHSENSVNLNDSAGEFATQNADQLATPHKFVRLCKLVFKSMYKMVSPSQLNELPTWGGGCSFPQI
jgi:hypothetical protein